MLEVFNWHYLQSHILNSSRIPITEVGFNIWQKESPKDLDQGSKEVVEDVVATPGPNVGSLQLTLPSVACS